MMQNTAAYYYNHKKKEICLIFNHEQWSERNLKAKGFSYERYLFSRPMTEYEIQASALSKRLFFYKYFSLDQLVEDEKRCNVSPEYIKKLQLEMEEK